ncbi:MAG: 4Fe-4S dicluster domain-containing protein [Methanosarcinaceae archaeon]|nr:4Fe-4S dicluster domain-containing protein [Methanosarcinaceae archaeon]
MDQVAPTSSGFSRSRALTIVPERCSGCRTCEIVCAIHNNKVNNPKKARIRLLSLYPHPVIKMPIVCRQCKVPKCMDSCPSDAIYIEEGVVRIDENKCVGCHECVVSCPFGAIYVHADMIAPFKCELCGGDPQCVKACPKNAILYVPEHTLGQSNRLIETLKYAHLKEMEYFEHGVEKKLSYAEIETGGLREKEKKEKSEGEA